MLTYPEKDFREAVIGQLVACFVASIVEKMMDEITIEEDIWKRGIASDSSVQGSVVKEKVSFWQTRNCQTDDSSSLQGSVVKEKVAFWQAHNGHPSAAKRKSSSSTNHRQTKSFEDSFIPPTIEFNRKKKFFDIERCLDDPSRELPRRHDQATPAAGLCHNNIFRQPKHKLQKKVAKTSPLASVPFNDSLFVRVDKELDAMKKDGTVGITQAGIEEEIVFECDSMLYHSESDVVTVASEEDDSSLVIDSNNNSNDYHHHKSPHSLRSQQSMFQNEYLSPNGRKSKSTRDRRCFDNSAFDCNRKAHPFSLKDSSISSSRSPGFKFALCIASLLLIAIGITGGCLLAFENSNQQSPVSLDHTKSDEYGVLLTSNSIRESLKVLFGSISGFEKLNDVSKPQNKTLEWMLDHTTLSDVDNREALVERYVLALVFFSLNGKEWDLERNFLSSRHVCEWNDQPFETGWKDEDLKHGVFCDKDNRVVHLLLGKIMIYFNFVISRNGRGDMHILLTILFKLNYLSGRKQSSTRKPSL